MKLLVIYFLLISAIVTAHPGTGLVKDSKGNIYYTDLENVWKISGGKKVIAVSGVHTHELYIDANDNLYGENERYEGDKAGTFSHYLWMLRPNGRLDTIVTPRQAYVNIDFTLERDVAGNEYYVKQFITRPDTAHIYKKSPDGKETIFATGNFKDVKLLHPQKDGSLLFMLHNNLYRADGRQATLVATEVGGKQDPQVYGIWQDDSANIYAAVYNEQVIKKIRSDGSTGIIYRSSGDWRPLHSVVDNYGMLWIMEIDPRNKVRVVSSNISATVKKQLRPVNWLIAGGLVAVAFVVVFLVRRR